MSQDAADARARVGVEAVFERYHKLAEKKSGEVRRNPQTQWGEVKAKTAVTAI